MMIWEVYVGRIPFSGLSEREVESKILKDERVDLDEISQPDVRALVAGYLVAGSQVEKLLWVSRAVGE